MTVNKSKRPSKGRSAANPSNYSQLYKQSEQNVMQTATPTATPTTAAAVAKPMPAQRTSAEVDWRKEYGYVFKDLRYLFIVSAILFAIIVVIGFFL